MKGFGGAAGEGDLVRLDTQEGGEPIANDGEVRGIRPARVVRALAVDAFDLPDRFLGDRRRHHTPVAGLEIDHLIRDAVMTRHLLPVGFVRRHHRWSAGGRTNLWWRLRCQADAQCSRGGTGAGQKAAACE